MIQDRELTDMPWKVFQHGHTGWWWTDANSRVCPVPLKTKSEAEAQMQDAKRKT